MLEKRNKRNVLVTCCCRPLSGGDKENLSSRISLKKQKTENDLGCGRWEFGGMVKGELIYTVLITAKACKFEFFTVEFLHVCIPAIIRLKDPLEYCQKLLL